MKKLTILVNTGEVVEHHGESGIPGIRLDPETILTWEKLPEENLISDRLYLRVLRLDRKTGVYQYAADIQIGTHKSVSGRKTKKLRLDMHYRYDDAKTKPKVEDDPHSHSLIWEPESS